MEAFLIMLVWALAAMLAVVFGRAIYELLVHRRCVRARRRDLRRRGYVR